MSDNMEHKAPSAPTPNASLIKGLGAASEMTRGILFATPYFENSIPPFIYWVPVG